MISIFIFHNHYCIQHYSNSDRLHTVYCIFIQNCAAKAIFYCPSMNSHRPRSQNTSKERTLNPEKDSTRKRPRSHVSLEKSSKNYKPLENWAKPNLLPNVTPQPALFWRLILAGLRRGEARTARISCLFNQQNKLAKGRGEGGVNGGLI
jgi:hypothetical protein